MELPDFPWPASTIDVDGQTIAYVDAGPEDAHPVWLLHGEPTWGYLWRTVLPPLLDAGYRCVVPDMLGFGRSSKPTSLADYDYDRHTRCMTALLDHLALRDATIVVHDWGGPVGLRLFVERPDAFARAVVMDTGVFTGHQPMSDAWRAFRDFVEATEDLPISFLVDGGCKTDLDEHVRAAYDWPFRDGVATKAGARAFPLMIPTTPDAPGAEAGQRVLAALKEDDRPKLVLWAAEDPIIPPKVGRKFADVLGVEDVHIIENASHFLQEDAGPEIGARIAAWLASELDG